MFLTLLPFLAATLLGIHLFSLKLLSGVMHPLYGAFAYTITGAFFLGAAVFFVWRQGEPLPTYHVALPWLILFAAVTAVIYMGVFFYTMNHVTSFSNVLLIVQAGAVVVGAALSVIFLQDAFSYVKICGFVLALLGMALVIKG